MPQMKHVVLVKFKPTTTPQRVREILTGLSDLRRLIPGLLDFSGGPYSSHENRNQGFTHGFVMTFADAASRDAYLPHPEHERVKKMILAELDGPNAVLAFDWEHQPG